MRRGPWRTRAERVIDSGVGRKIPNLRDDTKTGSGTKVTQTRQKVDFPGGKKTIVH